MHHRFLPAIIIQGLRAAIVAASPVALVTHGVVATQAADWTRFRGPNGSGIAADDRPTPVQFGADRNLVWKTPLPGEGVSSPIVVGDRVFVTAYSGYGFEPGDQLDLVRHLVCIDRSIGAVLWQRRIEAVLPEDAYSGMGVPSHGYASHTPASDGRRVYAFFGKSGGGQGRRGRIPQALGRPRRQSLRHAVGVP